MYDQLAFLFLSAAALAIAAGIGKRGIGGLPANLLLLGVLFRVVGATARYEILFRFYGGLGDAVRYYHEGLDLAREVWSGQLSPFSPDYWVAGAASWWGTAFIIRLSGLVLTAIGPSLRAEFLAFSIFSLLGILCIIRAQAAAQPDAEGRLRFATWMLLWPSLWFWPSSVGKEGFLMLAIGLATMGYVGSKGRIAWISMLAGLAMAFAVRPHVAAVLAVSALAANWMERWGRFGLRQIAETLVALVLAVIAFDGMKAQFGLEEADLEGLVEFVEFRAGQTLAGGSNIGGVPLGPEGAPLAFVNVWMRPFPWEAHNLTSAMAAGELLVFWAVAWRRRSAVWLALRRWRHHRLLRFAIPMLVLYTLMIGLTFGNLGIIARQRVLVFPWMLLIATTAPMPSVASKQAGDSVPVRRPIPST